MKNSVKTRFWVIIGSLIFLSFSFGLIFSENSYAKVKSEEDLWKLALLQGVPICYSKYANDSIDKGSFTTIDTDRIFNQGKKDLSGSTFGGEAGASTVFLPTYVYSFASDTNLEKWSTDNGQRDKDSDFNCKQVFNGWDTNLKGLKDLYTLPTTFEGWGYETGDAKITAELSVDNTAGYRLNNKNKKMELSLIRKGNGAGIDSCSANIEIVKVDAENIDKGTYVIRCISNQMVVGRKDVVSAYADGNLEETVGGLAIAGGYEDVSDFIAVIDLGGMTCVMKGPNDGCLDFDSIELPEVKATLELLSVGYVTNGTNQPILGSRSIPRQGNGRRESGQSTTLERVFGENVAPNLSFSATGSVDSSSYTPIGGSKTSAAKRMLYLMDSVKSLPALKRDEQQEITYQWTNSYIYSLYYYYLQDAMAYYNGKKAGNILIGGGEDGCGGSVADGWTFAFRNAKEEGEDGVHAFCKVEIQSDILSEVEGLHVSVVDMREQNGAMKRGTFKEVLDWFKSDAAGTLEKDEYTNLKVNDDGYLVGTAEVEQPATEDPNASGTVAATCQNAGGAGSLGWIVCPILEWMGNAAEDIYTSYIEPSLKIDPRLFQEISGGGSPTQDAWRTFQTIANVVFIILLLIVIFSQLTGVGIDNYGIKRILPKLIVVAILVNLSYLICVICVDLSNILGSSLKGLFDSLGASLTLPTVTAGNVTLNAIGNVVFAPLTILVALVLAVTVGIATGLINPGFLLTLLIAALGVVISILFVFVLFAVRGAAVVVLTVVSPIAFVCYALPNTKKIFDKWLKALQMLLLVYPICGLLLGGGDYVSRLLLAVGGGDANFFQLMTAMVVGIVPIFFIPTLLKGSFAAMGNIGAKVSGVGKALSGRATKAATNSGINKRLQQRGSEHQTRLRAGVDRHGNEIKMGGFRRFMRGGTRSIAQAREQYTKDQNVARRREGLTKGVGFTAALIAQQKAAERDELSDYMTLINDQTRNGEQGDKLNDMFDEYMENGNKAGAVAVARIAGRRKDTAASFMKDKLTGVNASKYDSTMLQSVAKEIATGENSGNYLTSSPLGFEFAAQLNRGTASSSNYSDWVAHQDASGSHDNVHNALDHYVTDSRGLVGVKNSSLGEIADLMQSGNMDAADVTRLRNLANETIDNRDKTGVWDTTKAENIYKIAGRSLPVNLGGGGNGGNGAADNGRATGAPDAPGDGRIDHSGGSGDSGRSDGRATGAPDAPGDGRIDHSGDTGATDGVGVRDSGGEGDNGRPSVPASSTPQTLDPASVTDSSSDEFRIDHSSSTPASTDKIEAERQVLFENNGVVGDDRLSDGILERAITEANHDRIRQQVEMSVRRNVAASAGTNNDGGQTQQFQPRQFHQTRTFNPTNLSNRRELRQQRREIRNNRKNPPV